MRNTVLLNVKYKPTSRCLVEPIQDFRRWRFKVDYIAKEFSDWVETEEAYI